MKKILLTLLLFPCMLFGQVTRSSLEYNKKIAVGIFDHSEALLPTVYFEFRILPRLSVEPQLGMMFVRRDRYILNPQQDVLFRRFGAALELHYYFLFNRRHPLEGIFAAAQIGTYRSNSIALRDRYMPYRNYQVYQGLGLGGNWYFQPRFSAGGSIHLAYTAGTDYLFRSNGTVYVMENRSGFVLTYGLQAGFSF